MPTKKYTENQIEQAKEMRQYGATLRELPLPQWMLAYLEDHETAAEGDELVNNDHENMEVTKWMRKR